ncbi:hypothetical protein NHX12_033153, partial [Muraenolepis orangiensis]
AACSVMSPSRPEGFLFLDTEEDQRTDPQITPRSNSLQHSLSVEDQHHMLDPECCSYNWLGSVSPSGWMFSQGPLRGLSGASQGPCRPLATSSTSSTTRIALPP